MRECTDCHVDISDRHGNARRCRDCQTLRDRASQGNDGVRRACSAAETDCAAGRLRTGMCEVHYRRLRTTGTTSLSPVDHLTRYRVQDGGCWQWTGPMFSNGYGHISAATFGTTLAHRAFYAAHLGPIPDGMDLDHLCRNRGCVNPDHLEPVPHAENIQRGVDARLGGRCRQGHDMADTSNVWVEPSTGRRYCRPCKASREKRNREKRRSPDGQRNALGASR